MNQLVGKAGIITGAASGIGAATARVLGARGRKVTADRFGRHRRRGIGAGSRRPVICTMT